MYGTGTGRTCDHNHWLRAIASGARRLISNWNRGKPILMRHMAVQQTEGKEVSRRWVYTKSLNDQNSSLTCTRWETSSDFFFQYQCFQSCTNPGSVRVAIAVRWRGQDQYVRIHHYYGIVLPLGRFAVRSSLSSVEESLVPGSCLKCEQTETHSIHANSAYKQTSTYCAKFLQASLWRILNLLSSKTNCKLALYVSIHHHVYGNKSC